MELHYELKKASNELDIDDRNIILNQLLRLDDKETRIKQAYREGIDNIEEYKKNKQLLKDERSTLEKQLEVFSNTSCDTDSNAAILKNISSVYDIIKDTSKGTLIRANAIRSVVDHCVYDKENDKLEIYFFLHM